MKTRENSIENYVAAYNSFDVSKMVSGLSADIIFENIQSGELTLKLQGIEAFQSQAETAKSYFSKRHQTIKSFTHKGTKTEIEIGYVAVLAIDLPNGLKKGQEIRLNGKSIFEFKNDKIVKITDIS